jgi:hypothetical protein
MRSSNSIIGICNPKISNVPLEMTVKKQELEMQFEKESNNKDAAIALIANRI